MFYYNPVPNIYVLLQYCTSLAKDTAMSHLPASNAIDAALMPVYDDL